MELREKQKGQRFHERRIGYDEFTKSKSIQLFGKARSRFLGRRVG